MNSIIKLSDNAALRIKEIMSNAEKESLGVRVSVKSGGCAGMSYVMEYTKEINPNDEVIEDKHKQTVSPQDGQGKKRRQTDEEKANKNQTGEFWTEESFSSCAQGSCRDVTACNEHLVAGRNREGEKQKETKTACCSKTTVQS